MKRDIIFEYKVLNTLSSFTPLDEKSIIKDVEYMVNSNFKYHVEYTLLSPLDKYYKSLCVDSYKKNSTNKVKVFRVLERFDMLGWVEIKQDIKKDGRSKICTLKKDIEIIKDINKKYPDISPLFQVNDDIVLMIISKHLLLILDMYEYETDKIIESDEEVKSVINLFKSYLHTSLKFFELCLDWDSDTLEAICRNIRRDTKSRISFTHPYFADNKQPFVLDVLGSAYEACLVADSVEKWTSPSTSNELKRTTEQHTQKYNEIWKKISTGEIEGTKFYV